jgi:hypothetical protein
MIDNVVSRAKTAGIDFIVFGGMTLKPGRQQEYYLNVLRDHYPELLPEYASTYPGGKYGAAISDYYRAIAQTFNLVASKYKMAKRMPAQIFNDILHENDLVIVILEQLDYLLRLKGAKSPYGYAAYSISKLAEPLSSLKSLRQIKGVGQTTEKAIREIIRTGSCVQYEKLLRG